MNRKVRRLPAIPLFAVPNCSNEASNQHKGTRGRERIAIPWLTDILRPRRRLLDRIPDHELAERLGVPRHDVDIHAAVPPVA
jgi:hypothetical protein